VNGKIKIKRSGPPTCIYFELDRQVLASWDIEHKLQLQREQYIFPVNVESPSYLTQLLRRLDRYSEVTHRVFDSLQVARSKYTNGRPDKCDFTTWRRSQITTRPKESFSVLRKSRCYPDGDVKDPDDPPSQQGRTCTVRGFLERIQDSTNPIFVPHPLSEH
jgi:hypothetical protein